MFQCSVLNGSFPWEEQDVGFLGKFALKSSYGETTIILVLFLLIFPAEITVIIPDDDVAMAWWCSYIPPDSGVRIVNV